ncbi:MAG: hypothetical protein QOE14_600, partial [Humisphaera sp.]|nr:hypothetical protein [Humisphaera sp.]
GITVFMLRIARLMNTVAGWVLGALFAVGVGAIAAVIPIRGRAFRVLLLLILGLLVLGIALSVLLPLVSLMDSISAGKK